MKHNISITIALSATLGLCFTAHAAIVYVDVAEGTHNFLLLNGFEIIRLNP